MNFPSRFVGTDPKAALDYDREPQIQKSDWLLFVSANLIIIDCQP